MSKKTIRGIDVSGKQLLIRVDFNVPLDEEGRIASDRKMRACLPTIQYALQQNSRVVLMTHWDRPGGERDPKRSTKHLVGRLKQLLQEATVHVTDKIAGPTVKQKANDLKPGEVLLLENLRFDPGETQGDEAFARQLQELGEIYVNDAFAACHRLHASLYAVPELFPKDKRVIGFLVEQELQALNGLLKSPRQPLIAILGGAKVKDKLLVVEALLRRVEKLLLGGAMAYTFLKARGQAVGDSPVEASQLELARRLLDQAGDKLVLPQDHVVAPEPKASAEAKVVDKEIPDGWSGLDIGPKTIEQYRAAIREAATIVWNGPLGQFEAEPFRQGTAAILQALAEAEATTVAGGGESGEAVEQQNLIDGMDHVSTGGGAFLEYLKKGTLPALSVIDEI